MAGNEDTPATDAPQSDVTKSTGTSGIEDGVKDKSKAEETTELKVQVGNSVKPPKMHWPSTTNLWCSSIGRSHAHLWDFGIDECPRCGQILEPTSPVEKPSKVDYQRTPPKRQSKAILHAVEYRDNGNNTIGSEPWEGEFDLDSLGLADSPAFEIVTVLLTSIQANNHRQDWEAERLIESEILKKPNIRAKVVSKRLTVHSAPLLQILRRYVFYYPSATVDSTAMWLEEPFALVAHHYREIQAHFDANKAKIVQGVDTDTQIDNIKKDEDEEVTGLRHLGWLLAFFKKAVLDDMINEQNRHADDMCTFRMLWLLYKPGMTVYHESDGHLGAYVLQSVDTDPGILSIVPPMRPKSYTIKVWSLDFDGKYVGRVGKTITIAPFEGVRPIRSLQLVPSDIIDRDDNGKWREKLEDNGKKWYQLLPGGQVHYSGPVLGETKRQTAAPLPTTTGVVYGEGSHPELVLDWVMFETWAEKVFQSVNAKTVVAYDPIHPLGFLGLTMTYWILLSTRTLLFQTQRRDQNIVIYYVDVQLDVTYCNPPRPNIRAIDTLVMPPERKDMIKALIQKFTSNDLDKTRQQAWRADYIENKGDECIAEYTERPLLSLTCGDIGTNEVKMEAQLSKWFQLAEKWGAVMLIDEADVYLERRQVTDLKRNSLVAVFLRCIEYYRGILFLTTNRVGQFDDAFISRIHVIIHYEKLNPEGQKKVWMQFFDKLDYDREDFKVTRRAKDYILEDGAISEMEWNGREIRNAFQTAVALADYRFQQGSASQKQPTLDQRDFEQVCEMMKQFKSYL
ncbi:unnamed protein product, partial [Fusarium langsethiae]